ncbi:hypothetical protein OG896_11155 [Streptomyces sp. NBC_00669]|nr:hypothetical protein [Streptomyces sp. NBC_00669]
MADAFSARTGRREADKAQPREKNIVDARLFVLKNVIRSSLHL